MLPALFLCFPQMSATTIVWLRNYCFISFAQNLDKEGVRWPPINHGPSSVLGASGTRHTQRIVLLRERKWIDLFKDLFYLVVLVDGLHTAPTGSAAVLGILRHGHNMLHSILFNLLQGGLSQRPRTEWSQNGSLRSLLTVTPCISEANIVFVWGRFWVQLIQAAT